MNRLKPTSMMITIHMTLVLQHTDDHDLTLCLYLIEFALIFESLTQKKALQQNDENQTVELKYHKPQKHVVQDDDKNMEKQIKNPNFCEKNHLLKKKNDRNRCSGVILGQE